MAKKTLKTTRKKPIKKSTTRFGTKTILALFFGIVFCFAIYRYKEAILYYLSFKTNKTAKVDPIAQARIEDVLNNHKGKVVGFDVSQYQGNINWIEVDSIADFKLEFVLIRATAGSDKVDSKFKKNWRDAHKKDFICGAYHYYRPNENSIEQAQNFINTVQLKKGDFPPVLDIEQLPKTQSIDSLKTGLKRWLDKVDRHYKIKPIIYTGEKYYHDFLKEEFKGYTFWIANYNYFVTDIKDDWTFWQFTEKARIKGIEENVDVNIYNGSIKMLQYVIKSN